MPLADIVVYNIGQLVTFPNKPLRRVNVEKAGILNNAGIAVRDGKIVEIGSSEWIRTRYRSLEQVNAEARLVTPGLVDPHTHLVFAGSREDEFELKLMGVSYVDILRKGGGIYRTVRVTQKADVGELATLARKRLRLMLDHGTVIVEAKSGYGLLLDHEVKMLEALKIAGKDLPVKIVPTLLAHIVPEEYAGRREEYIKHFMEIERVVAEKGLAKYVDVFCDKGVFTPEESLQILKAGISYGLRARMHADQLEYIGCSDIVREIELDSIDHLEKMPEKNARLLAERGVTAILTPSSILAMMETSRPPIDALRREGVPIAIASDFNPNNMTPVLQTVMDLSTYILGLTPLEALAAATVNAAWSLRVDGGQIVEGAPANILVWEHESYKWIGYEWGYNKVLVVIAFGTLWRKTV